MFINQRVLGFAVLKTTSLVPLIRQNWDELQQETH